MTIINTEDQYIHCKEQLQRQVVERDALNETILDIGKAVQLWESEHPPEPESQQEV